MKRTPDRLNKNTVQGKMYRLMLQMFIPIAVILVSLFVMLLTRNIIYASVSGNIVKASGFNQNFGAGRGFLEISSLIRSTCLS